MRTAPRVVVCSACGNRQRVDPVDVRGLPMDLPRQWRMVGRLRDRRPILLCPDCIVEARNDDVSLSARVVDH